MTMAGTYKLIDSKATAENPFSLEIQEIIPGLLIRGPSWGALERLQRGEPISEVYALQFEGHDCLRGIGAAWRRRNSIQQRGKDRLGIGRNPGIRRWG